MKALFYITTLKFAQRTLKFDRIGQQVLDKVLVIIYNMGRIGERRALKKESQAKSATGAQINKTSGLNKEGEEDGSNQNSGKTMWNV